MMFALSPLLHGAVVTALAMITVSMFLVFYRLIRGPGLPDRVVALDALGTLTVGFIAAYTIAADQPLLLDAATVVALVAFLGTVAFAHYVEKRGADE